MALPPENPMNDDQHVDSWLISYADLITLLLCFFVIIVSMSKPQEERIKTRYGNYSQGIWTKR
jgi:flagellar motor protein MotB